MASTAPTERDATLSNEELLIWSQRIRRARRELDEANGRYRAELKAAKKDGVNTAKMIETHKATKIEPEEVVSGLRTMVHYMRLVGISGLQPDAIFADDANISEKALHEADVFEAEDLGYRAGRAAQPIDENPFDPGTEHHVAWAKHWHQGQKSRALELGPTTELASAAKNHPGREPEPKAAKAEAKKKGARTAPAPAKKPSRKRSANGTENVVPIH